MATLTYILDSNIIADRLNGVVAVASKMHSALQENHRLCLCQPVHYEVSRGLLKTRANRKQLIFVNDIVPLLDWIELVDGDWTKAAQLWAQTTASGKQLSDVDLLVAALAIRLDAIVVSSDADFDALSVTRVNWRV
jgi:predicted nucleic acid-binding protein